MNYAAFDPITVPTINDEFDDGIGDEDWDQQPNNIRQQLNSIRHDMVSKVKTRKLGSLTFCDH